MSELQTCSDGRGCKRTAMRPFHRLKTSFNTLLGATAHLPILGAARADDMLDIMGWSGPSDPMAPSDPNSDAALQATLDGLRANLAMLDTRIPAYGLYTSGPFAGQWRKQALIAAYASHYTAAQVPAQVRHTQMFFNLAKSRPWFLGALWWEPTACFSAWEKGDGLLYKGAVRNGNTVATPTATLTAWGAAAVGTH